MYGDLLCISIDNSFQEPIWATAEKHVEEQGLVTWVALIQIERFSVLSVVKPKSN